MAVNRMGPPCPKCGSLITDVSSTHRNEGGDFVRRRICPACQHRFNTVQPREVAVHRRTVQWKGRVPTIFWEEARTDLYNFLREVTP